MIESREKYMFGVRKEQAKNVLLPILESEIRRQQIISPMESSSYLIYLKDMLLYDNYSEIVKNSLAIKKKCKDCALMADGEDLHRHRLFVELYNLVDTLGEIGHEF